MLLLTFLLALTLGSPLRGAAAAGEGACGGTPRRAEPGVAARQGRDGRRSSGASTHSWLAFFDIRDGNISSRASWLDWTPAIIVYRDGRMIWRDQPGDVAWADKGSPAWREGRVAQARLKAFIEEIAHSSFVKSAPPSQMAGHADPDDPDLCVGVNLPGVRRAIAVPAGPYIPPEAPGTDFVRSMLRLRDSLLSLRPAHARSYEGPVQVIFAAVYPPDVQGLPVGYWPDRLQRYAAIAETRTVRIAGPDAHDAMAVLTHLPLVRTARYGVVQILWRPDVAVPMPCQRIEFREQ